MDNLCTINDILQCIEKIKIYLHTLKLKFNFMGQKEDGKMRNWLCFCLSSRFLYNPKLMETIEIFDIKFPDLIPILYFLAYVLFYLTILSQCSEKYNGGEQHRKVQSNVQVSIYHCKWVTAASGLMVINPIQARGGGGIRPTLTYYN